MPWLININTLNRKKSIFIVKVSPQEQFGSNYAPAKYFFDIITSLKINKIKNISVGINF